MVKTVRGAVDVRDVTDGDDKSTVLVATAPVERGALVFTEVPVAMVVSATRSFLGSADALIRDSVERVAEVTNPLQTLTAVALNSGIKRPTGAIRTPPWPASSPEMRAELVRVYGYAAGDAASAERHLPSVDATHNMASAVCGNARRISLPYTKCTLGFGLYVNALVHMGHACDCNCVVQYGVDGTAFVFALRPICVGDRLTLSLLSGDADMRLGPRLAFLNDILVRECVCAPCCVNAEPVESIDMEELRAVLPKRTLVTLEIAIDRVPAMLIDNKLRSAHTYVAAAVDALIGCGFPLWTAERPLPMAARITALAARVGRLYWQTRTGGSTDAAAEAARDRYAAEGMLSSLRMAAATQCADSSRNLANLALYDASFYHGVAAAALSDLVSVTDCADAKSRLALCVVDAHVLPWLGDVCAAALDAE